MAPLRPYRISLMTATRKVINMYLEKENDARIVMAFLTANKLAFEGTKLELVEEYETRVGSGRGERPVRLISEF